MTNESTLWLQQRLGGDGDVVIIDGGMGTELEKSGVSMDGYVWSGRAVMSHPNEVRRIHEEYIKAGAEVIIANTFATSRHMLEPGGLGDEVARVNKEAVMLAKQARDRAATGPVAIVGSVCEWAPADHPKWRHPEAVKQSCQEQVGHLVEAGVDLIALEMGSQIEFAIAATEALLESGLPIWLGLSAKTHQNCESLSVFDYAELDFESLVKALADYPAMAMNIMHTPVTDVNRSLDIVKRHWHGPIGVYPESGYFEMPNWQFVDVITPEALSVYANNWVEKGVRMLGGCCGLGPKHIAELRKNLG